VERKYRFVSNTVGAVRLETIKSFRLGAVNLFGQLKTNANARDAMISMEKSNVARKTI